MQIASDVHTKLKELSKDKKLIPFIGAGFSVPLELPSWNELIRILAEKLEWDSDVFLQSGNYNYLQLAEYFVIKKSKGELRYALSKEMIIRDAILKKSRAHRALTDLQPKIIYTTNYDEGIEQAFKLYSKNFCVIRNINDFENPLENHTLIYKFHGDFVDDDSLVLTETSYFDRMAFEDPLDIRLRSDILNNTLLFLGYGFNDINTRFIFFRLAKIKKELRDVSNAYSAVMVTFGISEIQREILKKWNVEIIELDPIDKSKSLSEFLESLNS
jgi:hypothetical protein